MATTKPTVQDLQEFTTEHKVLFCSEVGGGKDKKLYVTLRGSFEVWNKQEKIYECMQPFSAIEKYNEI